MNTAPIVLVDDDEEDKYLFEEVLQELGFLNPLIWFNHSEKALRYLKQTTQPHLLIICDMNLPGLSGIEFKKHIDQDPELRKKAIPFVFYSTSVDQQTVNRAYTEMTVQGYFKKSGSYDETKRVVKLMLDYWTHSRHSNST
ncbi:response regulator [Telluribacter humicola]|uniref:response regulator n=1 Tax=Telluribacter humicola TaxID=1720261 RepID=UPI001A959BF1|nr:response regulator [Telluribacter humicola]